MNNQYYKIKVDEISDKNIEGIIKLLKQHPDKSLYVNVKNTKYISEECLHKLSEYSNMYIRIEGGYDDDRLKNYPDYFEIHMFDNIYNVSEVIRIIRELKNIESGIYPNWSEEQKLLYFISFLQDRMVYTFDDEKTPSKVIRSLRGLYTRKTVCAGFSMILKELCDRSGIECNYVEGATNKKDAEQDLLTHAWNIVKIKGNYFPIDVTFSANKYIRGEDSYIYHLFNATKFIEKHIPGKYEKLQDYKNNLKSMDATLIRKILETISKNKFYDSTKFYCKRKDGSRYLIYQIGSNTINSQKVYKYVYCDFLSDNKLGLPIILYSETNISDFIYQIDKKQKDFNVNMNLISEFLLSKNNILQAVKRRNGYIGSVLENKFEDTYRVIVELDMAKMFANNHYKVFKRKDGSSFIAELVEGYPVEVNNQNLYSYNILEYYVTEGNVRLKSNTVYADFDIFKESKKKIVDNYLSRIRIDERVRNFGGYLGHLNRNKVNYEKIQLEDYFDLSKRIDMEDNDLIDLYTKLSVQDMKELISNYKGVRNGDRSISIYERKSGKLVNNLEICIKAKFANLWVYACCGEETKADNFMDVAFSKFKTNLFNNLSRIIEQYLLKNGNINTVGVLFDIRNLYRNYNADLINEIVTKLFSSDETNKIVNDYYRLINPSALKATEPMEELIDVKTARKKLRKYKEGLTINDGGILEVVESKKGTSIKRLK